MSSLQEERERNESGKKPNPSPFPASFMASFHEERSAAEGDPSPPEEGPTRTTGTDPSGARLVTRGNRKTKIAVPADDAGPTFKDQAQTVVLDGKKAVPADAGPTFKDQAQTVVLDGKKAVVVPPAAAAAAAAPISDDNRNVDLAAFNKVQAQSRRPSRQDPPPVAVTESSSAGGKYTIHAPTFKQDEDEEEGPSGVRADYQGMDVNEQPYPGTRPAVVAVRSSLPAHLPSFKDQVRPLSNAREDNNDNDDQQRLQELHPFSRPAAVVARQSRGRGDALPSFKDQVRRNDDGEAVHHDVDDINDDKNLLPPTAAAAEGTAFKQAQTSDTSSQSNSLSSGRGDAGIPIIAVHAVDDGSSGSPPIPPNNGALDDNVYSAQAFALSNALILVNRRSLLAVAGLFLVATATIGGVCGAGHCVRGLPAPTLPPTTPVPTTSPTSAPSPQPTSTPSVPPTVAPSPAPSSLPTIDSIGADILDFVNSITFTTEPIRYPLPQESTATPEELAVHWLIQEDPLALTVNTVGSQARLTQRYALLTLWYSTNGPAWTENGGWLEEEDECSWYGIFCNDGDTVEDIGDLRSFEGNGLDGHIPPDIALLPSCRLIHLSLNTQLTGPIPSSITTMTSLTNLALDG